jgi:hypothetical protein
MHTAWKSLVMVTGVALTIGSVRTASAQTGFDGVATFVIRGENGRVDTAVQTTKGNKIRFESLGHAGAMIYNGDDNSRTIMMDDRKQYMHVTQAQQEMMGANKMKTDAGPPPNVSITPAGTSSVAGVSCQLYHTSAQVDGKQEEGDVCVAEGVGFTPTLFMGGQSTSNMSPRMAAAYQAMKKLLSGNKGIVKITGMKDGKPISSMELIKVQRQPVPDAAFAAPPDYTELKIPQMGGMKTP